MTLIRSTDRSIGVHDARLEVRGPTPARNPRLRHPRLIMHTYRCARGKGGHGDLSHSCAQWSRTRPHGSCASTQMSWSARRNAVLLYHGCVNACHVQVAASSRWTTRFDAVVVKYECSQTLFSNENMNVEKQCLALGVHAIW